MQAKHIFPYFKSFNLLILLNLLILHISLILETNTPLLKLTSLITHNINKKMLIIRRIITPKILHLPFHLPKPNIFFFSTTPTNKNLKTKIK
jgi:hypothetical protein